MTQLTNARIPARISTKKTIHLNTTRSPGKNNGDRPPKPVVPPFGRCTLQAMAGTPTENWKDEPEEHNYPAAEDYLSLLVPPAKAKQLVARLRKAAVVRRKGKDLLRTSRLPPLPPENAHVARNLKKVREGRKLSPVLLVRGRLTSDVPLTIADGYHRVCASYHLDEDADIPCRIVDAISR